MKRSIRAVISLVISLAMTFAMIPVFPVAATAAEQSLPAPVIMSFEWNSSGGVKRLNNCQLYKHGDNITEGSQELVVAPDGTKCVRLDYLPYGSFANFRMMPQFNNANQLTDKHGWIRITYMCDTPIPAYATIQNNAKGGDKVTIVQNTAMSRGEWVTSNAVYFATDDMLNRFIEGKHCTIGFYSDLVNSFYIKEIAFFCSEEQAYEYYHDKPKEESVLYSTMTFGTSNDTGSLVTGDKFGTNSLNYDDSCVDISYASSTNMGNHYIAKLKFINAADIQRDRKYMRVYYSADLPTGQTSAEFTMRNDKGGEPAVTIDPKVTDTNGFVLTNTIELTDTLMQRISGTGEYPSPSHCSFLFSGSGNDGEYRIKYVLFFPTKAAADAFVPIDDMNFELTINGNPIENYSIIIPEDPAPVIRNNAQFIARRIKVLTDIEIPVLTDDAPKSEYEILVGATNRPESAEALAAWHENETDAYQRFVIDLIGNKLVLNSRLPFAIETAANNIIAGALYEGWTLIPEQIDINENIECVGKSSYLTNRLTFAEITNVSDPEVFTEDFNTDDGYFTEEQGADLFHIGGGKMYTQTDAPAMTYIHVYEYNTDLSADITYSGAGDDGNFGLMLRSTSDDAYVKAFYDANDGEWRILDREGIDFNKLTKATKKMTLDEGETYNIRFVTNGDTATLYVDGTQVLSASGLVQNTPGRVGFFAEDTRLEIDNVSLTLLSGQGTILRNVAHTKLPDDRYREGGSVFEMEDGSLNYTHQSGTNFKSTDNGRTWQRIDAWTSYTGYVNMLRLVNGKFMKIASEDGYMYSYTSDDEGKTWTRGGVVTQTPFRGNTSINAGAGNMNDKINQSASGRIFYSQNYETTTSHFSENGDGIKRKVFCEFFYSDDNGANWSKSDTTSWTIKGNETAVYFGECKILECADGTIRMYNSWNDYGCIVYSESTDGGKTFGPLVKMPEFPCARSSMQFFRDPYGETDYTYYMVWVNTQDNPLETLMPRSSLTLAKSTDGKTWTVLGDLWRWQSSYRYGTGAFLNHIVDPFIKTTEDYVIVGTGLSEQLALVNDNSYHGAQRQHIWSIPKSSLGTNAPVYPSLSVIPSDDTFYENDTFTADIVISTESGDAQAVNAVNFSLDYNSDILELVSLTPAASLGGEYITNGAAFGWMNGTDGIAVTAEPTVIATATFKVVSEINDEVITDITVGDGDSTLMSVKLADAASVYIPEAMSSGDITLRDLRFELKTVESGDYLAIPTDTKLLMLIDDGNDRTYTFGNYNFYWSSRYSAHVAIIGADITDAEVMAMLDWTDVADADVLSYNGDVMGDGYASATSAAQVSEILHNRNGDFTDRMRLEADVFGDDFKVTSCDAMWILYASVGLIFGK